MKFPQDIFQYILSFVPRDSEEYKQFKDKMLKTMDKGKKLRLPRFERNLRYDAHGLYSYETLISEIDWKKKTITRLGWWSKTSSRHHNWFCQYMNELFGFTEVKVKKQLVERKEYVCRCEYCKLHPSYYRNDLLTLGSSS